jgi:large subunit ribosomal protein L6
MSRVANNPIQLPKGVEVKLDGVDLTVKGGLGSLALSLSEGIKCSQEDNVVTFDYDGDQLAAMAGTTRALVNNMVKGVSEGWEKKLVLNGVGYRAKVSKNSVNLTVGLSHPVDYELPEGVTAESPSPTEVVLKGIDKQAVGQAAAEIRGV